LYVCFLNFILEIKKTERIGRQCIDFSIVLICGKENKELATTSEVEKKLRTAGAAPFLSGKSHKFLSFKGRGTWSWRESWEKFLFLACLHSKLCEVIFLEASPKKPFVHF
jgi:hypothetical protein